MDIKNFQGESVRLGEFPSSLDVSAIADYHSNYGVCAKMVSYRSKGSENFVQLRRKSGDRHFLCLFNFQWEEQEEKIAEEWDEIIFDSRVNV